MDLRSSVRIVLSNVILSTLLLCGACSKPATQPVTASQLETRVAEQPQPEPLAEDQAVAPTPEAAHPAAAAPAPEAAPKPEMAMRSSGGSTDDLLELSASGHASGSGRIGGMGAARLERRAMAAPARMPQLDLSNEGYAHVAESGFVQVKDAPLSTFSVDVDTASYSNVRRMLRSGQLPPADAVRVEEMINYFDYDYASPAQGSEHPIAVNAEVSVAPWAPERRLVRIALQARDIERLSTAPRNLVFLIDVSGSMKSPDKLPLLKRGLAMLARDLREQDSLAIVVYAGSSGLALPATSGADTATILGTLERLEAGGSTNGGEGIELAYRIAQRQFVRGGINRVILATDGDFNVGTTSEGDLTRLIENKRKGGVYLTVLGFGTGNLKDSTMEALADKGNGNYAYIDSIDEAHKVLVREAGSTLVTVAKDVKAQVEWNPTQVASYRLVGYDNRRLADRDFADDTKDAGDMGAGHTVTALYDVTLASAAPSNSEVGPLRYQSDRAITAQAESGELLTVKIRYKRPDGGRSALLAFTVRNEARFLERASNDFRFAAAVAGFGMLLKGSEHAGAATVSMVRDLAASATSNDAPRERLELIELMDSARRLGLGG